MLLLLWNRFLLDCQNMWKINFPFSLKKSFTGIGRSGYWSGVSWRENNSAVFNQARRDAALGTITRRRSGTRVCRWRSITSPWLFAKSFFVIANDDGGAVRIANLKDRKIQHAVRCLQSLALLSPHISLVLCPYLPTPTGMGSRRTAFVILSPSSFGFYSCNYCL